MPGTDDSRGEFDQRTIGEVLEALSDVHRRRLLMALWELGPEEDAVRVPEDLHDGGEDADLLRTKLYHVHLPKLEEAGFVEWDGGELVARGPRFRVIESAVESAVEDFGSGGAGGAR